MKTLLIVLAAALLASCATTPSRVPLSAQVTDHGILEAIGPTRRERNPSAPGGFSRVVEETRLVQQTNRIPARVGVIFGIRYRVVGVPNTRFINLRKVVHHPPMTRPDGSIATEYSTMELNPVHSGEIVWETEYYFENGQELLPGTWTFELWLRETKLLSYSFTVYPRS